MAAAAHRLRANCAYISNAKEHQLRSLNPLIAAHTIRWPATSVTSTSNNSPIREMGSVQCKDKLIHWGILSFKATHRGWNGIPLLTGEVGWLSNYGYQNVRVLPSTGKGMVLAAPKRPTRSNSVKMREAPAADTSMAPVNGKVAGANL